MAGLNPYANNKYNYPLLLLSKRRPLRVLTAIPNNNNVANNPQGNPDLPDTEYAALKQDGKQAIARQGFAVRTDDGQMLVKLGI